MEGKSSSNIEYQIQVAPFVAKAYQMVNDPRTDALIRWGKGNNSFLVLDPADFSQLLLPFYFKHSNFSSFVRQLNTYGFKKVDPDRWEFAHESFLRGQTHLLTSIVRRQKRKDGSSSSGDRKDGIEGEEEEERLIKELGRLRQEQRALQEELQGMSERLQATEMRPRKMMSFLVKVAEDPDFLPRLILSRKQQYLASEKKQRLVGPPTPPPLSSPHSLMPNGVSPPSDIGSAAERTNFCPLEHRAGPLALEAQKLTLPMFYNTSVDTGFAGGVSANVSVPQMNVVGADTVISGSQMGLLPEFGVVETSSTAKTSAPFPFSLLGHGFF
ncbi:heat stress transcription factor C-1b [Elaeis guineensis]|uniref:Heat stress transcription factor C-1b n=1 Tax=Elaeis guineensis var. tenera TaxID=51953 RepID=A0A6I9QN88_ELAGV|nr:heat stress transcription factor C-1b [Elaeis guineensis]